MTKRVLDYVKRNWDILIFTLLLILSIICISSCKSTEYIEVEKVKKEYRDRLVKDSIYIRDSVYMYVNGDTVYKERLKLIYKDRLVNDTVCKIDSIPYKIYVDRVEYKHPKYELYLWVYVFLTVGGLGIWYKYKRRVK